MFILDLNVLSKVIDMFMITKYIALSYYKSIKYIFNFIKCVLELFKEGYGEKMSIQT